MLEVLKPSIKKLIESVDVVIVAGEVGPAKLKEFDESITFPFASLSRLYRKNPVLALLEMGFLN